MQTVTAPDGTRIAYERHGSGPPLVLLHGGSSSDYWGPVVPHFSDDYTVVTPDRRGHGESGDHDEYSLDREIADVLAVLDTIEGDPILFGHSFGGLQAIEAARETAVAGVVAYEPAVLVGEYRETADLAARMQARLDAGDRREAMRLYFAEVLFDGDTAGLDAWLDEWPAWPEYARMAEQTIRMNRAIEGYRLPDRLALDAPTLLLTGTDGPAHLRDSVRAVHEAVPDSRLVEFEGVGHAGPTEATERVVDAVRAFLRDAVATEPVRR